MVHPSSHMNYNDSNEAVFVFGEMWIFLACLLRPDSWSVSMCEGFVVLLSGSLAVISFVIIIEAILLVACFSRCIFTPESAVAIMLLLIGLFGASIQFIKLFLGLIISILFNVAPNRHLHPFSLPPSILL